MHLLIYVVALLLGISALGYQAFSHAKDRLFYRTAFEHDFRVDQVCAYNQMIDELWKSYSAHPTQSIQKPQAEANNEYSSKINFRLLIDKEKAEQNPENDLLLLKLVNNLLNFLFDDQLFYQRVLLENPQIFQTLIAAVREAQAELPIPVKRKSNLGKIELKDPMLQSFWYELLRLNPVSLNKAKLLKSKESDILCLEYSLKSFLSDANSEKIHLYLAPRAILFAIVQDMNRVEEIIAKRYELYKQYKGSSNEATEIFKSFSMAIPAIAEFEPILAFNVTGTNPKDYD